MTGSCLVCIKDPTETSQFIYENTPGAPALLCAISLRLLSGQSLELSMQLRTKATCFIALLVR